MPVDLRDHLLTLELALANRDVSLAQCDLIDLIAPDFLEFGASGRRWDPSSIASLLEMAEPRRLEIEGFDVAELAADVVLATFRLDGVNRTSIWVRRDGRWQMRFHQGTTAMATPSVGSDERSSE